MDSNSKRELVKTGTSVVGSFIHDMLTHRNNMKQIREEKEMEVELARARQNAGSNSPSTEETVTEASGGVGRSGVADAIADLRAREDCETCQQLLEAIEHADAHTQAVALTEYGRFRQKMDEGATEEELRAVLDNSEALRRLLN